MPIDTNKIRTLRRSRKLTQVAAAARAMLNQSQWSRIESGERYPSLLSLERVAKVLGVPARELMKQGERP